MGKVYDRQSNPISLILNQHELYSGWLQPDAQIFDFPSSWHKEGREKAATVSSNSPAEGTLWKFTSKGEDFLDLYIC